MSFLDDERQEMAERLRQHGAPERPAEQEAKIAAANRYNSGNGHHGQTERNAFWKGWDEHREYALRPDHVTTELDDKGRPTRMIVGVAAPASGYAPGEHPFQGHPTFSPHASFGCAEIDFDELLQSINSLEVRERMRLLFCKVHEEAVATGKSESRATLEHIAYLAARTGNPADTLLEVVHAINEAAVIAKPA